MSIHRLFYQQKKNGKQNFEYELENVICFSFFSFFLFGQQSDSKINKIARWFNFISFFFSVEKVFSYVNLMDAPSLQSSLFTLHSPKHNEGIFMAISGEQNSYFDEFLCVIRAVLSELHSNKHGKPVRPLTQHFLCTRSALLASEQNLREY